VPHLVLQPGQHPGQARRWAARWMLLGCFAEDAERPAHLAEPGLLPIWGDGAQGVLKLVHRGQRAILVNCEPAGPAQPRLRQCPGLCS
jgi:hypothetical protein